MPAPIARFPILVLALAGLPAQIGASQRAEWKKPTRPFHIVANIYYVGAAGVSAFLITDPAGAVLMDGGLPETAPQIARIIAALGCDIRQVKYLLNSHAHFDHSGGLAELKRRSGAGLVDKHNENPKLFIWTAKATDILENVKRSGTHPG